VTSYTITATDESRMYDGIRLRNRSWPAVSHNCSRIWTQYKWIVNDTQDSQVSTHPPLLLFTGRPWSWICTRKFLFRVITNDYAKKHMKSCSYCPMSIYELRH